MSPRFRYFQRVEPTSSARSPGCALSKSMVQNGVPARQIRFHGPIVAVADDLVLACERRVGDRVVVAREQPGRSGERVIAPDDGATIGEGVAVHPREHVAPSIVEPEPAWCGIEPNPLEMDEHVAHQLSDERGRTAHRLAHRTTPPVVEPPPRRTSVM